MSLISVNNLTFRYDASYNNIFENVSFNIDTDWKLGLIGRNGKGKTTFLKLLQGKLEYTGIISKSIDVDYFPFEITNKDKMSIEIVNEIAPNVEDWEIIKELNLLNADAEILYRNFNLLSGGQKKKILIAKSISEQANIYIWDEPLNYIDILTRIQIEEAILNYKPTLVFVEHDETFIEKVATKIINLEK